MLRGNESQDSAHAHRDKFEHKLIDATSFRTKTNQKQMHSKQMHFS